MIETGQNDVGSFIVLTSMNDVTSGSPEQSTLSAAGQFNSFNGASIVSPSGDIRGCSFKMKPEAAFTSRWSVEMTGFGPGIDFLFLWVVTGPGTRQLLKSWGAPTPDIFLDFTEEMLSGFMTTLPGVDRQIFFTTGEISGGFENPEHADAFAADGVNAYSVDTVEVTPGCFEINYAPSPGLVLGSTVESIRGISIPDYTESFGFFTLVHTTPCDA